MLLPMSVRCSNVRLMPGAWARVAVAPTSPARQMAAASRVRVFIQASFTRTGDRSGSSAEHNAGGSSTGRRDWRST